MKIRYHFHLPAFCHGRPPDRRVLRTQRAILDAFSALLTEREFSEITVKELADRADINRKTFYNYYPDLTAVMHELEDGLAEEVLESFKQVTPSAALRLTEKAVLKPLAFLNEDVEFYGHLLSAPLAGSLGERITERLVTQLYTEPAAQPAYPPERVAPLIECMVSGTIAAFIHWYRSMPRQPFEHWLADLETALFGGFGKFLFSSKITTENEGVLSV